MCDVLHVMGSESNHVTGASSLFIATSGWEVNKYIDESIFFILLACISETLIMDNVQHFLLKFVTSSKLKS